MDKELFANLEKSLKEIKYNLEEEIVPFWMNNGIDNLYGGYLTCFNEHGELSDNSEKYIVTQTRMIWGFSALYRMYKDENYRVLAEQGVKFLINKFWDKKFGGWFWKVKRDGTLIDDGKVVYGQTFAIYALSEYTIATGDPVGEKYAKQTFDLLQKYCVDSSNGGYFENLENDWRLSEPGFAAGDLKSLDIHMHILEAYTTLYECTKEEIHRRKLEEIIDILLNKMVNVEVGCGYNQFDIYFNRKPAINIRRTWNAERETGEVLEEPKDSTSYGHNCEFVWLLNRAAEILGKDMNAYEDVTRNFVDHTLKYGFDDELGGVYRDGPHEGSAYVKDKEWWQNNEVLVGFLDAYERLGDQEYAEAFIKTWHFDNTYMINHEVGEWRQLLTKEGDVIVGQVGNPWKGIYHTGRAMMECKQRLERILEKC